MILCSSFVAVYCVYDTSIIFLFFFLVIRRPPRSTLVRSSAASDVYKRQTRARGPHASRGAASRVSRSCRRPDRSKRRQGSALVVGCLRPWLFGPRRSAPTLRLGVSPSCLLYPSPSPRDRTRSRMPSSSLKKKKTTTNKQHIYDPHDMNSTLLYS